jgi:RNA polymerase sigma-70 factor (ECF subfamily)
MDTRQTQSETPASGDFSCLYEANYKRIFNYFLYGTTDIETSLDLTSDTFFKALRAWPRFEQKGATPTTWLFKIASRELAMYYRKKGRWKSSMLSFDEEVTSVHAAVNRQELLMTQRDIENCEEFLALSELIRNLPAKYREVVFLRFYAEMSINEISDFLGRSSGTVKSQLHRSMKKLRLEMQPMDPG